MNEFLTENAKAVALWPGWKRGIALPDHGEQEATLRRIIIPGLAEAWRALEAADITWARNIIREMILDPLIAQLIEYATGPNWYKEVPGIAAPQFREDVEIRVCFSCKATNRHSYPSCWKCSEGI